MADATSPSEPPAPPGAAPPPAGASRIHPAVWVLVGVAAVLLLFGFGGMGMMGAFGWGWMAGMMLFWLAVPVAIVVLLVWLIMELQRRQASGPRGPS